MTIQALQMLKIVLIFTQERAAPLIDDARSCYQVFGEDGVSSP